MQHLTSRWSRLALAALVVAALGTAGFIKLARGSDHQDTPDVELNPASDMTDVYAFPGSSPDRTVLVLNSWAFITPAQTAHTYFDQNLLYQFKIDNNTDGRSEEHTSELQSQSNLVCRLLLEKKKKKKKNKITVPLLRN